jgi:hypothetical protein
MYSLAVGALILALVALILGVTSIVLASQTQRGPRGLRGKQGATGPSATSSTGTTNLTGAGVLSVTYSLNNAQLLNLSTAPITVLPPLTTAGQTYLIVGCVLQAHLNQQLSGGSDLQLTYQGAVSPFVTFFTKSATQGTAPNVSDNNTANVQLSASTDYTGSTTNSLTITIYYLIVPTT